MLNLSGSVNISAVILRQNQANTPCAGMGGSIYTDRFPPVTNARLAFIDARPVNCAQFNQAGVPEALYPHAGQEELFSPCWEEYIYHARAALSDCGSLALSAPPNENADFKLLLDKIFGSENFVRRLPITACPTGGVQEQGVVYIYSKNKREFLDEQAARKIKEQPEHLKPGQIEFYGQKPGGLTEEIILGLSSPGDAVLDLTCGEKTAIWDAYKNGRRFAGAALNRSQAHILLMRLLDAGCPKLEIHGTPFPSREVVNLNMIQRPGGREIYLDGYGNLCACSSLKQNGLEQIDVWAVGRLKQNAFISERLALRRGPIIESCLKTSREKDGAVYIADIYGREKIIALA